ncbi:DUF5009 domain-containing protein, partial [candidate division KSB1 bacterium]|nr:DUF5009 domain-containing protein [candidate division KSB1 bacterium]
FGFLTRPVWGISKIRATPSWTAICAGINTLVIIFLYISTDKLGFTRWAKILAPAGHSTLTCYLIPYYIYAIFALTSFRLPAVFTTGMIGIVKSVLFALFIIILTGWLGKIRMRLKI